MRSSESLFVDVRGLRYHVRRWAGAGPKIVLLHGWMDVSASFQFLVDALRGAWDVYAPDWRGYGLTGWGKSDCYWFPDYIADLDLLLEHITPREGANLVGHSLGGNVACMYAGIRPERVARVVNLESFGLADTQPADAPRRYARWLGELREAQGFRPYESFEALAERMRRDNPRLSEERAGFLARHWGRELDGKVVLRGDPAHKLVNPVLYRYEESRACWHRVTAPVLWVDATDSALSKRMGVTPEQQAERRAAFRRLEHASVADAGHMLHHDQPEACAELIEKFLAA